MEKSTKELTEDKVDRAVLHLREIGSELDIRLAATLSSVAGVIRAARENPEHDPLGLLPFRARRLAETILGESE